MNEGSLVPVSFKEVMLLNVVLSSYENNCLRLAISDQDCESESSVE